MVEDWHNRPSRGGPHDGTDPRYSAWPTAAGLPDGDAYPTDVYAALRDLASREPTPPGRGGPGPTPPRPAPPDSAPSGPAQFGPAQSGSAPFGPGAPGEPPTLGQPVPRDFVPPQIAWPHRTEPGPPDDSRTRWTPPDPGWSPEPGSSPDPAWSPDSGRSPDAGWSSDPGRSPDAGWSPDPGRSLDSGWSSDEPVSEPYGHDAAPTEVVGGAMIDLSAPRTHRGRRRRLRTGITVAALGAVLAGGTGYVLVYGLGLAGTTHTGAAAPTTTGTLPATAPVPEDTSSPATGAPPSAAGSSASASPSPARTTSPTTRAAAPTTASTRTTGPTRTASPTATSASPSNRPSASASASSPGSTVALAAKLTYQPNGGGYAATVTITNPGTSAVGGWTVRLTSTGATGVVVVGGGVSMARNGDNLVFTPASGAAPIAAGGSFTYAFTVTGSGTPSGCAINGVACS